MGYLIEAVTRNLTITSFATMSNADHAPSAGVPLRRERGGHCEILAASLDGQLARDRVAIAAERLHAGRDEARGRERLEVEPVLPRGLGVQFRRAGIDAGEIDVDRNPGCGRLRGVEAQLARELSEAAIHRHAHLGVAELDAALVGLHLRIDRRVSGGREGRGKDERGQ